MTKDEALKLALETLEADPLEMVADANGHMVFLKDKAITAIKEALAQPEQIMQDSTCSTTLHLQGKPYPRTCKKCGLGPCIAQPSTQPEQKPLAWISTGPARMFHWTADKPAYGDDWVPLYTTPPQRTWVGLTDEEIKDILDCGRGGLVDIKKTEAKLKDKNTSGQE